MTTTLTITDTQVTRFQRLRAIVDALCAAHEITLDVAAIDEAALAEQPATVCLAWQGAQMEELGVSVDEVQRYAVFGQGASRMQDDLSGDDLVLHFAASLEDAAHDLVHLDDYRDPAILRRWCYDLDTGAEVPFAIRRVVSFPRGGAQSDVCVTVDAGA